MQLKSPILFAACLLAAAWSLPAHAQAALTAKSIVYQGVTRTWYEYVPASYKGKRAVPLVIALHGYSDTGDKFATVSEWMPKADQEGFIAVFPNGGLIVGQDFGWNAFVYNGAAPDDVGFLQAMITQLESDYKINKERIYMAGFSNGAAMAGTFAAVHTSVLAAIAPVSSGWLTSFGIPETVMHPDAPIPVWVWRGTAETFMNGSLTNVVQDEQQVDFWRTLDGDSPTPQVVTQGLYTTSIYRGGKAEVRFTSIAGASHAYQPGTSEKLWDGFFSIFRRKGTAIVYTASAAAKPVISVTANNPTGTAPGRFLLTRNGNSDAEVQVQYELGGKAVNGQDYQLLSGERTILVGATSAHIPVRPLPAATNAGTLGVRLMLLPNDSYSLGTPAQAKLKITGGS